MSRLDETKGLTFLCLAAAALWVLCTVFVLNRKLKMLEEDSQQLKRDQSLILDETDDLKEAFQAKIQDSKALKSLPQHNPEIDSEEE